MMKKYSKILLISMFVVFVSTLLFAQNIGAKPIDSRVYNYVWKDDSLISGGNQIGKMFYVPDNMDCSDFTASLKIKSSPTLMGDLSSISVLINGTAVYSIMIDEVSDDGILTIEVPDYLIYKGGNSIVVRGFLKSTREKCEINSDVNWFVVEKGSSFSFNYNRAESTDISSIFDSTYYSDGLSGEVNIVLPNDLTEDNYSQISSLSALMGFIHKNKEVDVNIKTLKYSELHNSDQESIVIGTASQMKMFDKDLLTEAGWKKAEKNGYIALRKIGKKNHFILIASNESQLEVLCKILQSRSSLAQIKGKNYMLNKDKILNDKVFNINPSLRELGYEDSSQIGNGTKNFEYYFTIPANKILTTNNKLTFAYNYSALAESDKGYVTVAINGENLMSKDLAQDRVQDQLEFMIPEKYFDHTGFNISLKFNLRPSIEKCTSQDYDNTWITVDSVGSEFELDLDNRKVYSLLNAQGLLQDSNGNINGSIVIDDYKNISIDSVCQISSYFGKVSQGVSKLTLKGTKDNENLNRVILGLGASQLIAGTKSNLRIPMTDSDGFVNKELFIQNTASLGLIGITLNNDKLVIVASDQNQLNKTVQNYSSVISSKDTVILQDGEVIDYFGEAKAMKDTALEVVETSNDVKLALMLLLIASISIFTIYYKKVR